MMRRAATETVKRPECGRPQQGAALLVVLVMVALFTLLTLEFQREARFEAASAANAVASLEAHGVVRSGYAAAAALLKDDASNTTEDDRTELWYAGDEADAAHTLPVGEAVVSVRIEDQLGKFPLNSLWDPKTQTVMAKHREAYIALLDGLELENANPEDLADALIDWIDEDVNGPFEANSEFEVPNAPVEHVDELARIEGYDILSLAELARLSAHLDTRYEEAAVNYKINVNTAAPELLFGFHAGLTSLEEADTLYEELGETPLTASTLNARVPAANRLVGLTTTSDRFRLLIEADVRDIRRKADCIIRRGSATTGVELIDWTEY